MHKKAAIYFIIIMNHHNVTDNGYHSVNAPPPPLKHELTAIITFLGNVFSQTVKAEMRKKYNLSVI